MHVYTQIDRWVTDFVEECKLMSQLRHPHIVQFIGVCYFPESPLPILLMEKLQSSLDSLLETTPNIPVDVKMRFLMGACRGMVYLHGRSPPIVHRDLTARNILIDSGLNAKIADMGVAKMVTIQPGRLAATMTQAPGNGLYMPPEAIENNGVARYSTPIDIFSFGVVCLYTMTQTFPQNLKTATYRDPITYKLVARSEIERRTDYVWQMKRAIGETHPLTQLTLNCLQYDQVNRPSAIEVLRCLNDVSETVPKSIATKLDLMCQQPGQERQYEEMQQMQYINLVSQNHDLHCQVTQMQAINSELQADLTTSMHKCDVLLAENSSIKSNLASLQVAHEKITVLKKHIEAEKHEQVDGFNELVSLQQKELEMKCKEIDRLDEQIKRLQMNTQPYQIERIQPTPVRGWRTPYVHQPVSVKVNMLYMF